MAFDDVTNKSKPRHSRISELLNKRSIEYRDRPNPKREKFLAMLKERYGYTNEQSVDELERLLKQFYRTNKAFGIHQSRPKSKDQRAE